MGSEIERLANQAGISIQERLRQIGEGRNGLAQALQPLIDIAAGEPRGWDILDRVLRESPIPDERRVEPRPKVVKAALQAVDHTADESVAEIVGKLLRAAMDSDLNDMVSTGLIESVSGLQPVDILVLKLIVESGWAHQAESADVILIAAVTPDRLAQEKAESTRHALDVIGVEYETLDGTAFFGAVARLRQRGLILHTLSKSFGGVGLGFAYRLTPSSAALCKLCQWNRLAPVDWHHCG